MRVADIQSAITNVNSAMPELEQLLNEADSKLGDGDTGSMLARMFEAFSNVDLSDEDDIGSALQSIARAGASSTGSSLGTLIVVGLTNIANGTRNTNEIDLCDLVPKLSDACDAMLSCGGASLEDKTVIDILYAVAHTPLSGVSAAEARQRILRSCSDTMTAFRSRPCKIGRARMYPQESMGADDPGMLAFMKLVEVLVAQQGYHAETLD